MGKFQIEVAGPESFTCSVEQSAFLLRRADAGPTTCYFLSGILAALGEEIYKKKFVAKESKCAGSGYKSCEFAAFPSGKN
jgi:predicted hydrocarbon binding protein